MFHGISNRNPTGLCHSKVADSSYNLFVGSMPRCLKYLASSRFQGNCLLDREPKQTPPCGGTSPESHPELAVACEDFSNIIGFIKGESEITVISFCMKVEHWTCYIELKHQKEDARGNDVDLSQYKGKVLLIVNVAPQCGLTNSNYTDLANVYEKYKNQEILAFPCNQFGSQELGTNEEIVEFACTGFKTEYTIFDKVDVNGLNAAPLYKYLKSSKGGLFADSIKWNFSKFLVDKDGNVVDRHVPATSPLSIEKDINKETLGKSC